MISLVSRTSDLGCLFVLFFLGFAVIGAFADIQIVLVRWLCAAAFSFYWPDFVWSLIVPESQGKSAEYLTVSGSIGALLVSFGCTYDYFIPHFAQHNVYGDIPSYPGLSWTVGLFMLYTFITLFDKAHSQRVKNSK